MEIDRKELLDRIKHNFMQPGNPGEGMTAEQADIALRVKMLNQQSTQGAGKVMSALASKSEARKDANVIYQFSAKNYHFYDDCLRTLFSLYLSTKFDLDVLNNCFKTILDGKGQTIESLGLNKQLEVRFRGDYDPATKYYIGDMVKNDDGQLYHCIRSTHSVEPQSGDGIAADHPWKRVQGLTDIKPAPAEVSNGP